MAKKKNISNDIIKNIDTSLINPKNNTDIYIGDLPHKTFYGNTKVAIVFDDLDIVYKVYYKKYSYFRNRNKLIYDTIRDTDLTQIFPEQVFICEKNHYEIYTQAKCESFDPGVSIQVIKERFKNQYTTNIYDLIFESGYIIDSINPSNFGFIDELPVIIDFDITDYGIDFINDNILVYKTGKIIRE